MPRLFPSAFACAFVERDQPVGRRRCIGRYVGFATVGVLKVLVRGHDEKRKQHYQNDRSPQQCLWTDHSSLLVINGKIYEGSRSWARAQISAPYASQGSEDSAPSSQPPRRIRTHRRKRGQLRSASEHVPGRPERGTSGLPIVVSHQELISATHC